MKILLWVKSNRYIVLYFTGLVSLATGTAGSSDNPWVFLVLIGIGVLLFAIVRGAVNTARY